MLTLSDERLTLRPIQPADAEPLHLAARESLTELIPWMTWAHEGYSLPEMENYTRFATDGWAAGTLHVFTILDRQDGAVSGVASLSNLNLTYHYCNLGYWVRTSRRGQGLAGRAARLIARYGLEQLGLMRIEIVVALDNLASQRVAQKCGAQREGILRNRIPVHNGMADAVMYSLVPADFGLV
jgi:RimJ/RimL family protein N-acetyltransferase